ncbi:hypothetical protein [Aeromicrobium endophyticum]|uniref:Uncharacterized protein n=1 Tax=Aeromicrobium endophyticum TaxID=2292704 RepID=A0A371P3N9_9ACTN|nr:hypothetical protein [Aeromicrobium endophyticum]REK70130.1 hypothetical protein DX116_13235 [Aeromicrobium endophyticum]
MVDREDGPFEYYDEIYAGVTGDTIRADAQDPGLNASTLEALAGELDGDAARVASQLEGQITASVQANPETAAGPVRNLAKNGHYAVGLINSFAGMVDVFDTEVSAINRQYRSDLASALRYAGQAAAATESETDDENATEAVMGPQTKANLQPRYNQALAKLDEDADSIAVKFEQGPTDENVRELIRSGLIPLSAAGFWPGIQLTDDDRRQYFASILAGMTEEEQVAFILAHTDEMPPGIADVIPPGVQEQIADHVADDIEDPENIDTQTVALMALLQGSAPFADRLYSRVTPQEMSDAISELNYRVFGAGEHDDGSGRTLNGPPELELYDKFMNSAGITLATHSRSDGVDPEELARTWGDAIKDEDHQQNAAALTLLIREGGESGADYDPTFIDKLSSDMLEWEQGQDGPVWGPRNGADGVFIRDPDKVEINESVDEYGNQVYSVSGGLASDGMANLLAGMGSSPEGAQRFFTNDSGETDQERLEYLMLHRTFSESNDSDEGDGLGEALRAATVGGTEDRNGDYTDDKAAALATDLFQLIADNSGTDDHDKLGTDEAGGPLDGDMNNEWHVWEDMTDSLGAIGAGYSDDIYSTLGPGTGSGRELDVDADDLLRVVAEIGHSDSKTGLETLLAGVASSGMEQQVGDRLDNFVDGQGDGPIDMTAFRESGINLDTSSIGQVLGDIVNASDDVYNDEAMAESTRNAYVAKAFEIGTSFIPGGSTLAAGASDAAQNVVDLTKDEIISRMQDQITSTPSAAGGDYRTSVPDSMQYALANQFLQHGMLGEQANPGSTPDPFPGVQPTIVTDGPGGTQLFDPDLFFGRTPGTNADWDDWVNSNPYAEVNDLNDELADGFDRTLNAERDPTQDPRN